MLLGLRLFKVNSTKIGYCCIYLSNKVCNVYPYNLINFHVDTDIEDLKSFAKDQGAIEADSLTHWDITFWSERLRESKYDINEVLVPFFSLRYNYIVLKLLIAYQSLLVFLAGRTATLLLTAKGYGWAFRSS